MEESTTEKETTPEIKPELEISLEETAKIKLLQKIIASFHAVIEGDVTLKFTPTELLVRTFDKSRYALVDLTIKESFFKNFKSTKELFITIPLNRLNNILKRYRSNDTIIITFDSYEQLLLIEFSNEIPRDYTIPLVTPDEIEKPDSLPDPKALKYEAYIQFYHKQLTETIEDLNNLSKPINIIANKDQIIFSNSENKNTNKVSIPINIVKESNIPQETDGLYSQDLIKTIIELDKIFEHNTLRFGSNLPLILQYNNENIDINYLIAPQLPEKESEEDESDEEEFSEDDDEDWEEEEKSEEESEDEKPEEEYPDLKKHSMVEIERLADVDLKTLKIQANKQLGLDIKHKARKTTTLASIQNFLYPETKEDE